MLARDQALGLIQKPIHLGETGESILYGATQHEPRLIRPLGKRALKRRAECVGSVDSPQVSVGILA